MLVFADNRSFDNLTLEKGETYIMTVVNSIDSDRRMRLRLKSIRDTESFISKSSNFIKIYLDNLNQIKNLKNKLNSIQQGKNNVILVYNGYEVDTGIKLNYEYIPFNEINLLDGISINN